MPAASNKRIKSLLEETDLRHHSRQIKDSDVRDMSIKANVGKVAPFIAKLYKMLTSPALHSVCGFDSSGTTLRILDVPAFEDEILLQVASCKCACLYRIANQSDGYRGRLLGIGNSVNYESFWGKGD